MKGGIKTTKGFTLLELIVVIVIVGILATLGFTQYTKTIEKTRATEARKILGQIRMAQEVYNREYSGYTTSVTNLAIDTSPTTCTGTHYLVMLLMTPPQLLHVAPRVVKPLRARHIP